MTNKMSSIFQIRFKLLEAENDVREMENDVDWFKEQSLLMREAIKEKQEFIDRLRPRLERIAARENNHERV
jgi:hypothetical protein